MSAAQHSSSRPYNNIFFGIFLKLIVVFYWFLFDKSKCFFLFLLSFSRHCQVTNENDEEWFNDLHRSWKDSRQVLKPTKPQHHESALVARQVVMILTKQVYISGTADYTLSYDDDNDVEFEDGDRKPNRKQYLYHCQMRDGSTKTMTLSFLLSSSCGNAVYRSFCRREEKIKKNSRKVATKGKLSSSGEYVHDSSVVLEEEEEEEVVVVEEANEDSVPAVVVVVEDEVNKKSDRRISDSRSNSQEVTSMKKKKESNNKVVTEKATNTKKKSSTHTTTTSSSSITTPKSNSSSTSQNNNNKKNTNTTNNKTNEKKDEKKKKKTTTTTTTKKTSLSNTKTPNTKSKTTKKEVPKKKKKDDDDEEDPYEWRYYSIAEASKMEIPINVPVPWAKQEQARQRKKNTGRYKKLLRDCPAVKELNRLIKNYVDRYCLSFVVCCWLWCCCCWSSLFVVVCSFLF